MTLLLATNGFPYESIIARSRAKWRELLTKDNQDYYCTAFNTCARFLSNNSANGNRNGNDNDKDNKLFLRAYVDATMGRATTRGIVVNN